MIDVFIEEIAVFSNNSTRLAAGIIKGRDVVSRWRDLAARITLGEQVIPQFLGGIESSGKTDCHATDSDWSLSPSFAITKHFGADAKMVRCMAIDRLMVNCMIIVVIAGTQISAICSTRLYTIVEVWFKYNWLAFGIFDYKWPAI